MEWGVDGAVWSYIAVYEFVVSRILVDVDGHAAQGGHFAGELV
jgi:hypothetical protein